MLGAIGDSYSQAWTVTTRYKYDHPQFSWVVGNAKGDGVFSLRERFEALGDHLTVVDAATSGRKMSDAARQATAVVAAAEKLRAGSTVYVTFELGTNDLCDDPMTDPAVFETQLRAATAILESRLPAGSRILMLSVPDFSHFYAITQADPTAKGALAAPAHSKTCPPFLGWDTPYTMDQAKATLAAYNASLYLVCDEIEATDGASGKLHCRRNEALLSEKDFKLADLSRADYFHPSFSGQAKMAASAWKAGYWGSVALPPGATALTPGWRGVASFAGLVLPLPVGSLGRLRRLRGYRRSSRAPRRERPV
jgi:lysophospholipase L1-like esterase